MKKLYTSIIGAVAIFALSSSTASGITITQANINQDIANVLFNDDTLLHSGPLVQGNFANNSIGAGFIVDFTSTGGNLVGNGGQARLEAGEGNDPFTQVTIALEDNATFTRLVLNPFATTDGTITFDVSYISPAGLHNESFSLSGNGENFFTVDAGTGQLITSVSITATSTAFEDIRQIRVGGFATGQSVPDGGATVMLLGAGLCGLGLSRRFLKS